MLNAIGLQTLVLMLSCLKIPWLQALSWAPITLTAGFSNEEYEVFYKILKPATSGYRAQYSVQMWSMAITPSSLDSSRACLCGSKSQRLSLWCACLCQADTERGWYHKCRQSSRRCCATGFHDYTLSEHAMTWLLQTNYYQWSRWYVRPVVFPVALSLFGQGPSFRPSNHRYGGVDSAEVHCKCSSLVPLCYRCRNSQLRAVIPMPTLKSSTASLKLWINTASKHEDLCKEVRTDLLGNRRLLYLLRNLAKV